MVESIKLEIPIVKNDDITNIVISRYKNNTDFLNYILTLNSKKVNILIYDKEKPNNPLNIPVNKGNEASVYLKYIIDYYDNLSLFTFFIHDSQYSWHHSGCIVNNYNEAVLANKLYYNVNNKSKWNKPNMIPKEQYSDLLKWYNEYIEEFIPINTVPNNDDLIYGHLGSAQFLVHKDLIRNLPKRFYEKLYNWIITTDLSSTMSGRYLEWTWHIFWLIYPEYLRNKFSKIITA